MPDYTLENELYHQGFPMVCGIDEAGRGPLCGPVVAAACILPLGLEIEGLNDSKKLTPAKREKLFDAIVHEAVAWSVASASVEEIDRLNILEADLLAMRRAVAGLSVKPDFALIDGNINRGFSLPSRAVVHGDALCMSIAAASVLAKVTRDRICVELDKEYPMYGIARHKGYGTKEHMDILKKIGPAPIYRKQFIRFLNDKTDTEK